MAISFDSVGSKILTTASGTINWAHTTVAANVLVVYFNLSQAGSMQLSPKYGGVNLTKFTNQTIPSNFNTTETWYLVNPPLGLGTIVGTMDTSDVGRAAISVAYAGVNTSNVFAGSYVGTITAGTSGSLTTTLATNNWFIGMASENGTGTVQIGNLRSQVRNNNGNFILASDSTGGTLQWGQVNNNTALMVANELQVGTGVQFDATGAGSTTASTTITWTHTVTGTSPLLLAFISQIGTADVSSLKFAGQALTKVIAGTDATASGQELWSLTNPPTGLGTFNGTVTASSTSLLGNSLSFTGVDQTTPLGGSVAGTTAAGAAAGTVTLTTTKSNSWLVGGFASNTTSGGTAGQTPRGTSSSAFAIAQVESLGPIAAASTLGSLTWTFGLAQVTMTGVEVIPTQPAATSSTYSTFKSLTGAGNI